MTLEEIEDDQIRKIDAEKDSFESEGIDSLEDEVQELTQEELRQAKEAELEKSILRRMKQ